MYRICTLLLPAVLLFIVPASATAQWYPSQPRINPWSGDGLVGTYINASAGGYCYVYPRGRGYLFVNENGDPARFVSSGPNQLQIVAGRWNPNITATVTQGADGRTVLRFDAPFTRTGYWVKVD